MHRKGMEDELDLATQEFLKTYNSFRDAALKLMSVINSLRERNTREMESFSKEEQKVHEFLVQMTDEKDNVVEKCFALKWVAEEEK